jgi:hypothetical protein
MSSRWRTPSTTLGVRLSSQGDGDATQWRANCGRSEGCIGGGGGSDFLPVRLMAMILGEERMPGVQGVARYRGEFDEAI